MTSAVFASRKLRAASSVRGRKKQPVADGLQERIPHGPCLSVITLTGVVEAANTSGIWIAPQRIKHLTVKRIFHVKEIQQETSTFFTKT